MGLRADLRRDERGAILPFVGVALAALLGLVALSFDLGRLAVTRAELQSYADGVALAAAAELDGKPDAILRAGAAAEALIADRQSFGQGPRTLAGAARGGAGYTLRFLRDLPASDLADPSAGLTTDPARAAYAWVTVPDVTVAQGFARAFRTLSGRGHAEPQAGAAAIAGMTQMACDVTPLMFCLPPATAADAGGVWQGDTHRGEMVQLRAKGGAGQWTPGEFGFLDLPTGIADPAGPCAGYAPNGAQMYRCLIAAARRVTQCVAVRGVTFEPGQMSGLIQGLNTRFDIYDATLPNGWRSDPAFAPAPNVTKGLSGQPANGAGQSCPRNVAANEGQPATTSPARPAVPADSLRLPRDGCLGAGTCGRFGDGVWDRAGYLAVNHRGATPGSHADPVAGSSAPYPGVAAGSRYELYLAEIERAYGTAQPAPGAAPTGPMLASANETGLPYCAPAGGHAGAGRRLLIAAGIDCSPGYSGRVSDVPVEDYVLMFITEPVGWPTLGGASVDIYAEIVGSVDADGGAGPGQGGVFRDVVQLYR